MNEPVDPATLRVSDAEREHVAEILRKAHGQGMLDLQEFEQRAETAFGASTRGEFNAVLLDLPGVINRALPANPATAAAPRYAEPSGEPLLLRGFGSSLRRGGRWTVPARLIVRNSYGSAHLDFSSAVIEHPVVRIELHAHWGAVHLLLPASSSADTTGITDVAWGSVKDRSTDARGSGPHFVVTGRVVGASVTVRHARSGLFGRR
ncbi:MAG: DUF1707 SHOCT-like domain-containing protein [Sciscionella sp.]